ncbi:MAG: hypothetical protein KBT11_05035 [Treponema sp.]|nr:hypothetical protein [Candidatus Treponema equifaecale]
MMPSWRKFFSLAVISVFLLPAFAKKNKAEEAAPAEVPQETEFQAESAESTQLSLPEKKEYSFFSSIDNEILNNVKMGSPESLRLAINALKKAEQTEAESVLYNVAVSIMKICWRSVQISENATTAGKTDSYNSAIESAKQGIYDFNSGNVDFLTNALPSLVLAVSESRDDYYEASELALKKCLDEKDDSVFVNYLLSILSRRQKKNDDALGYLQLALTNAPGCYEIEFALAEVNYSLKNYDFALKTGEKLLAQNPLNKSMLKLCAYASFESGMLDKSEQYVNRVLQTEPENSTFMLFRTKILITRGEYIRAASLLDAYSRIDTTSRDYLYLRFKIQKEWNKNISAATATIEKALVLYPDDVEIIIAAAGMASENNVSINGWSGDELADQILEKDSGNYEAKKIKIQSMVQKKSWQEAYKASQSLVNQPGSQEDALLTHIKICLSAGRKEEAWKLASDLYARKPKDENALQSYIEVLVSTSRKNEASKMIAQLLPSSSAKMKSFLYYEKSYLSSDEAAVLADLRSSLTANPRNKDALFRLYSIYFNKKEYKKAQYYLKQVVALSPKDESLLKLNQQLEKLLGN